MSGVETLRRPLGALPDPLGVPTVVRPFDATVRPPGSKSLTNRALLLGALAGGRSHLRGALVHADDSARMLEAVTHLGARVKITGEDVCVEGVGGSWSPRAALPVLDLGNAGTATRFLAAASLLAPAGGDGIVIDGNARMRQRPIGELAGALREMGAEVRYLASEGYPPLQVRPPAGGRPASRVAFGRTASSQFVSALLLVAPWLPDGLEVEFHAPPTSVSYIAMTLSLLRQVGARVTGAPPAPVRVEGHAGPGTGLAPFELLIEPDASGATYFWAAAAMCAGSRVVVPGLGRGSLQGDARFVDLLAAMGAHVERGDAATSVTGTGVLRGIEADLSLMPDAAMTLCAAACGASGPTRMHGLRTLRSKETDRVAAVCTELRRVGALVDSFTAPDGSDEGLVVAAPEAWRLPVAFATYDDHRMAMSLALLGLVHEGVSIRDPGCVAKTYPGYWADVALLFA